MNPPCSSKSDNLIADGESESNNARDGAEGGQNGEAASRPFDGRDGVILLSPNPEGAGGNTDAYVKVETNLRGLSLIKKNTKSENFVDGESDFDRVTDGVEGGWKGESASRPCAGHNDLMYLVSSVQGAGGNATSYLKESFASIGAVSLTFNIMTVMATFLVPWAFFYFTKGLCETLYYGDGDGDNNNQNDDGGYGFSWYYPWGGSNSDDDGDDGDDGGSNSGDEAEEGSPWWQWWNNGNQEMRQEDQGKPIAALVFYYCFIMLCFLVAYANGVLQRRPTGDGNWREVVGDDAPRRSRQEDKGVGGLIGATSVFGAMSFLTGVLVCVTLFDSDEKEQDNEVVLDDIMVIPYTLFSWCLFFTQYALWLVGQERNRDDLSEVEDLNDDAYVEMTPPSYSENGPGSPLSSQKPKTPSNELV